MHSAQKNKLGSLRVILLAEEKHCCCIGLELYYASQGKNIDEAIKNFELGLYASIQLNLEKIGHIENFLCIAPEDIWEEKFYSQRDSLVIHSKTIIDDNLCDIGPGKPFHRIISSRKASGDYKKLFEMLPFSSIVYYIKESHDGTK